MSNCPVCRKPILNCGSFTAPARFNIRCPWCQTTLHINICTKITAEVLQAETKPEPRLSAFLEPGIIN